MADARQFAPDLAALDARQLLELFTTLESPTLDEMNGEYDAAMLSPVSFLATIWWPASLYNPIWPGRWRGKAFRPVNESVGRGYNLFRHFGRVVQRFPMRTEIVASRYDGRPAFQLDYRAYRSVCGTTNMIDEVRRVRPGVYLLMGTFGFTQEQRRAANPFVLTGPVAPYRGDLGVERAGYVPPREATRS